MREFVIEWETDYCDDFPESFGTTIIRASTKFEAVKRFYQARISKAIIMKVYERNKTHD